MEHERRVEAAVQVPGYSLKYSGSLELFESAIRPLLAEVSRVEGRPAGAKSVSVSSRDSGLHDLPEDDGLVAELGRRGTRSAERDAVLCGLVDLAGPSSRDVRPLEILSLLAIRGYPGRPRVKSILSKLRDRQRQVEPGVAPGTWRPSSVGRERILGLRAIAAE